MGLILDRRFVNLIVGLLHRGTNCFEIFGCLLVLLIILLRRHPQYVTGRDAVEEVWRGRQTSEASRGARQLSFESLIKIRAHISLRPMAYGDTKN